MLARTTRRGKVGLIAGLLTAGVGIALVVLLRGNTNGPTANNTPTGTTAALVATQDIPSGTKITSAMVAVKTFAPDQVPIGSLNAANQAVGQSAIVTINKNQIIDSRWIVSGDPGTITPTGQSSVALGKGDVALAIPVDPLIAAGFYIQPGDRVDVMVQVANSTVKYGFQDVLILKVGSSAGVATNQGGAASGTGVSRQDSLILIALPRRQAEQMTAATIGCPSACPPIHIARLVLRPHDDYGKGNLVNGPDIVGTVVVDPSVGPGELTNLFK